MAVGVLISQKVQGTPRTSCRGLARTSACEPRPHSRPRVVLRPWSHEVWVAKHVLSNSRMDRLTNLWAHVQSRPQTASLAPAFARPCLLSSWKFRRLTSSRILGLAHETRDIARQEFSGHTLAISNNTWTRTLRDAVRSCSTWTRTLRGSRWMAMALDGRRRCSLNGHEWYSSVDHVCRVSSKQMSAWCSDSGHHVPALAVTSGGRRVGRAAGLVDPVFWVSFKLKRVVFGERLQQVVDCSCLRYLLSHARHGPVQPPVSKSDTKLRVKRRKRWSSRERAAHLIDHRCCCCTSEHLL